MQNPNLISRLKSENRSPKPVQTQKYTVNPNLAPIRPKNKPKVREKIKLI